MSLRSFRSYRQHCVTSYQEGSWWQPTRVWRGGGEYFELKNVPPFLYSLLEHFGCETLNQINFSLSSSLEILPRAMVGPYGWP